MTAADRTAPRASGGVLFRLWLARLRIRRALVLHRIARLLVWVEDAEAVIGACTMTRGRLSGRPFCLRSARLSPG